jgi:hypothetical protein
MNRRTCVSQFLVGIAIILIADSCSSIPRAVAISDEMALKKINFSIGEIDKDGLIGPPDGKRLMAYKFVIPMDQKKRRQVHRIDRSVKFFHKPSDEQYDCIGEGATPEVLLKLAGLPFIKRIDPFYGE